VNKYDTLALNKIPINEVIEFLGAQSTINSKQFKCFNAQSHSNNDKKPSLSVNYEKNRCKCWSSSCPVQGGPIDVAIGHYGNFIEACKELHEAFSIPYLDSDTPINVIKRAPLKKIIDKPIVYQEADYNKSFQTIELDAYYIKYNTLQTSQRLKIVYTTIYRYALTTEQSEKYDFYVKRHIDKENPYIHLIGILTKKDIKPLTLLLERLFGIDDLITFNLYNDDAHTKFPNRWKYFGDYTVVPNFDLYVNMVNSMMFRLINPFAGSSLKELQISRPRIASITPFPLTIDLLKQNDIFYIVEGHPDGLALPSLPFLVSTGTEGIPESMFGLLKGKTLIFCFDQDVAGKKGMFGYLDIIYKEERQTKHKHIIKEGTFTQQAAEFQRNYEVVKIVDKVGKLDQAKKAGCQAYAATWNPELGTDINELKKEGNLLKVIKRPKRSS
jgi:DNA primase